MNPSLTNEHCYKRVPVTFGNVWTLEMLNVISMIIKTSCRFEFSTSDYPWIHISFIAIVTIPHNVLKYMGAIFAIGNSVWNYCHWNSLEKYFVNFSLRFLNHHNMLEFYGVSVRSYSVQCRLPLASWNMKCELFLIFTDCFIRH